VEQEDNSLTTLKGAMRKDKNIIHFKIIPSETDLEYEHNSNNSSRDK
jgi:hypothetical protein